MGPRLLSVSGSVCMPVPGQAPIPKTPWHINIPEPLYIHQHLQLVALINLLEELLSLECRKLRL